MNKKTIVMLGVMVLTLGAFARPHGGPGFGHGGPGPRGGHGFSHRMPPPPPRHHHHHSHWRHGGFWPGFVGGMVGGALVDAWAYPRYRETVVVQPQVVTAAPVVVNPAPVVVNAAPVVQTQSVWVEGRYIDQVQSNGTVVRVWQPGHYETRSVTY